MRSLSQTLLPILLVSSSGCGYLTDRGRDAMDILTATVEAPHFGAKAQAGPLAPGLYCSDDYAAGIGLVGGTCDSYEMLECSAPPVFGSVQKRRHFADDPRWKDFHAATFLPVPYWFPYTSPLQPYGGFVGADDWRRLAPQYTQIEAAAAVYGGVRLGVNPGELVDFVFGWFGLDIYADDVGLTPPPSTSTEDDPSSKSQSEERRFDGSQFNETPPQEDG